MSRTADHLRIAVFGAAVFLALGAGSVAEQRARLPPPADCPDPVAGVWKSHTYTQHIGRWDEFLLRIHRVDGSDTALEGTIHNHAWQGKLSEPQPPAECLPGTDRTKFATDGVGSIQGMHVEFRGTGAPRIEANICGIKNPGNYNLDAFAGDIDAEINEFQTLNNDGGVHVNFPVVFRRIACEDGSSTGAPQLDAPVEPPPFQPPAPTSGCGW